MDRSLSRRERHKADKRERIKRAATELFREKGFDAATTREIAERADVAIGTVFTYARDKNELLLLVLNDRLDEIAKEAETTVRPDMPLADQLLNLYRRVYAYLHAERSIALDFLREMPAILPDDPGQNDSIRFIAKRRLRFNRYIRNIIERARADGRIAADGPNAEAVAWIVVAIYTLEVRNWLAKPDASVEDGLRILRGQFAILIEGLKPLTDEEPSSRKKAAKRAAPKTRATRKRSS